MLNQSALSRQQRARFVALGVLVQVLFTNFAEGGDASSRGQNVAEAFSELDALLTERIERTSANARSLKRSLTVNYRKDVLEQVLPKLRRRTYDARTLVAEASSLPEGVARANKLRQIGALYQATIVASQLVQLEVAMMCLADYADEQGQSSFQIASQFRAFEADMRPLLEAAQSLDPDKLKAALPDGVKRYEAWLMFVDKWARSINKGERWSQTAILVADSLMLAASVHQLGAMGSSKGTGPPFIAGFTSGGAVAAGQIDTAAIARAAEAIRKLIAAGALDPTVVAGLSILGTSSKGGSAAPQAMAMATSPPKSAPSSSESLPKMDLRIEISKKRWGAAAHHVEQAIVAGKPRVLTIDRAGKLARREAALASHQERPRFERDEYPPAMFKEGGKGASVAYVDPSSNHRLGAYIGNLCRGLPDGARVEIVVVP